MACRDARRGRALISMACVTLPVCGVVRMRARALCECGCRGSRVSSSACALYAPACLSTMKKSHISHNRIMNADRCASLASGVCVPGTREVTLLTSGEEQERALPERSLDSGRFAVPASRSFTVPAPDRKPSLAKSPKIFCSDSAPGCCERRWDHTVLSGRALQRARPGPHSSNNRLISQLRPWTHESDYSRRPRRC
jgi:hypothetical protein